MKIATITPTFYRIPLPVVLSDSTHGDITHFDFITARVLTDDGLEGVGYTFTPGTGGSAIYALLQNDLHDCLVGQDARRIEHLWNRMWWHIHFAGRGGAAVFSISAVDIALWDLVAKAAGEPWWRYLGGYDNRVRAYAGGVDLHFTLKALVKQAQGRGGKARLGSSRH